jgi:DNA-binding transcriptional ArsR family regulator
MLRDEMDAVFHALAHHDRRRIVDVVRANPGCCVEDVCAHFTVSRVAVLKHLRVLQRADLIVSEKKGRKRTLYFNVVPIQLIYDRWATELSAHWAGTLADIKYRVEGEAEQAAQPKRKRHA